MVKISPLLTKLKVTTHFVVTFLFVKLIIAKDLPKRKRIGIIISGLALLIIKC